MKYRKTYYEYNDNNPTHIYYKNGQLHRIDNLAIIDYLSIYK